jgi:hypothetical protein
MFLSNKGDDGFVKFGKTPPVFNSKFQQTRRDVVLDHWT